MAQDFCTVLQVPEVVHVVCQLRDYSKQAVENATVICIQWQIYTKCQHSAVMNYFSVNRGVFATLNCMTLFIFGSWIRLFPPNLLICLLMRCTVYWRCQRNVKACYWKPGKKWGASCYACTAHPSHQPSCLIAFSLISVFHHLYTLMKPFRIPDIAQILVERSQTRME